MEISLYLTDRPAATSSSLGQGEQVLLDGGLLRVGGRVGEKVVKPIIKNASFLRRVKKKL